MDRDEHFLEVTYNLDSEHVELETPLKYLSENPWLQRCRIESSLDKL